MPVHTLKNVMIIKPVDIHIWSLYFYKRTEGLPQVKKDRTVFMIFKAHFIHYKMRDEHI